jgi:hypothetical protein
VSTGALVPAMRAQQSRLCHDPLMTSTAAPRPRPARRLTRPEAVLLGVALALSLAVLVGAFTVPIGGESFDSSDPAASHVETLTVATESGLALVVCVLPLLATLVVGRALWRQSSGAGLAAAWAALVVLGLGTLASIMSIGFALLPVAVCLFIALVARVSRVDPPGPPGPSGPAGSRDRRDGVPGAPTAPPA